MFKKFWKRYVVLPTPVELGHVDNYLPVDLFEKKFSDDAANKKAYTWEDYRKEVSSRYPVKYWLNETLPGYFHFLNKIKWKVDRFSNFIVSYTVPSRRYHKLSLVQPKRSSVEYRYGWIDSDQQIMLACFNILVNFVEKEVSKDWFDFTDDDYGDPATIEFNAAERKNRAEILACYDWWKRGRAAELARIEELYQASCAAKLRAEHSSLLQQWVQAEKELDHLDTSWLKRVIEVRGAMWT